MVNILSKKNSAGIFVLILLAAGIAVLLVVPINNLVTGQTNNNTSETKAITELERQQQNEEPKRMQTQEERRPNHPPGANAGSDKKIEENTNAILDARRSSDPDGDQIAYLWRQTSGPRVTIENASAILASFIVPKVNSDTSLTFALIARDERGAQDVDSVKFSIRNIDRNNGNAVATEDNNANLESNTNTTTSSDNSQTGSVTSTTSSTPTILESTTEQALSNAQTALRNNGSLMLSSASAPTYNSQLSRSTVFTPQAISPNVGAVLSNNFVNTRAAYDLIFRTASTAAVAKIEATFPAGTGLGGIIPLEVSGIGPGATAGSAGQTLTYTVANPVSIPAGVFIRLEVWNIINPPNPAASLNVQIRTLDSSGNEIDSGTSNAYPIKQVATGDIADNAILGTKIGDGQVGSADIAGNSISSNKIQDGTVSSTDLVPGAVGVQMFQRFNFFLIPGDGFPFHAEVTCNPGEFASGGGFLIEEGSVIVLSSQPVSSGTWGVDFSNDSGSPIGTRITVQCLKVIP